MSESSRAEHESCKLNAPKIHTASMALTFIAAYRAAQPASWLIHLHFFIFFEFTSFFLAWLLAFAFIVFAFYFAAFLVASARLLPLHMNVSLVRIYK